MLASFGVIISFLFFSSMGRKMAPLTETDSVDVMFTQCVFNVRAWGACPCMAPLIPRGQCSSSQTDLACLFSGSVINKVSSFSLHRRTFEKAYEMNFFLSTQVLTTDVSTKLQFSQGRHSRRTSCFCQNPIFALFLVSGNTKVTTKEPRTRNYLQKPDCDVLWWWCLCVVCVCEIFLWLLVHVSTKFDDRCVRCAPPPPPPTTTTTAVFSCRLSLCSFAWCFHSTKCRLFSFADNFDRQRPTMSRNKIPSQKGLTFCNTTKEIYPAKTIYSQKKNIVMWFLWKVKVGPKREFRQRKTNGSLDSEKNMK